MKNKKTLILLAFIMMLYIAPVIFISSYGVILPTDLNTSKDFHIASEPWLDGWDYRKAINITGSSGAGANYQINVTVERIGGEMQTDFDDIRFTDDDGVTLLDYWLEYRKTIIEGAPFLAWFWTEVKDNLDSNQTIYMYYGNSGVSTTSNGTATFLFFDDFENNNLDRWDSAGSDWEVQSNRVKRGTYAARGFDTNPDITDRALITNLVDDDKDIMIHMWGNRELETSTDHWIFSHGDNTSASTLYGAYSSTDDLVGDNGPVFDWVTNGFNDDTWYELEFAIDYTNSYTRCWWDGVSKGYQDLEDLTGTDITTINSIWVLSDTTASEDMFLDDYYIRNWVLVEPEVDSWGDEEEHEPPVFQWNVVQIVTIWINTPLFAGTLDMLLIFGGLILIPASTLYAVKGGREEMSTDKLFYVLIAFVIGWALVIGGIYA